MVLVGACSDDHWCRIQLTGGVRGEVRVWELRSREMVAHLKEHTMAVTDMVRVCTAKTTRCVASGVAVSALTCVCADVPRSCSTTTCTP